MKKSYQNEEKKPVMMGPRNGNTATIKSKDDMISLGKINQSQLCTYIQHNIYLIFTGILMDKWACIGSLSLIVVFNIIYWTIAQM